MAKLRIPTGNGKAFLDVEFDRGVPNAGPNYRPATFATSDPVVQKILESSYMFNSLYKIYKVVSDEPKQAPEAKNEIEQLPSIYTMEEAVSYLKGRGAKATQLKDNEAIKKYAEKIGVAFPNLNL